MREKISVIVPVYNVEKYLSKCLDSIMTQTYKNLEIILVNDGSTDTSPDICEQYRCKDERITVIYQNNKGLSGARNTGIAYASGELLLFVDSDDYILPNMIEALYARLKKDHTEMAVCSFEYVDECGNKVCRQLSRQCEMKDEILSKNEMFHKISHKTPGYWYYVISWGKLFRKSIFEQYRFPDGKLHEDEFAIHHIIDKVTSVSIIEERLYMYLQRTGSIMNNNYTLKRLDAMDAFLDRADFYKQKQDLYLCRDALKAAYEVLAGMLLAVKDSEYQKQDLKKAVLFLSGKLICNMELRGFKLLLLYLKTR